MKIKLFAQLQVLASCQEIEIDTRPEITADELWELLEARFPGIIDHRDFTRIACNFVYAERGARFHNHDEIALIPPVSGG